MQYAIKILIAFVAVAVAWNVGPTDVAQNPPMTVADPARGMQSVATTGQFKGMAVQLHGGADVYEKYHRLIPEIAQLGADSVLFVVHGWQEHAGSMDLHIDARKTADPVELGKLCDLATAHGLRIILMPVVLLDAPRNNEWRGKIIPAGHDWDAWFKRYNTFIQHFAKLAEKHKVAVLMVGSELIKTEVYTDRWKKIIQEVRQNYRGKLGYSSNWDHYQTSKIGFWGELDYIGMTTYYELAGGPNPKVEEIDSNWGKIKREILAFQREVKKPIIFTEVGWCSQEGAAKEGWNYYASQKATENGHREQLNLYQSFIRTWAGQPGIGGIIWWEWDPTPGGKDDFGYTPRGKPAEAILRELFAQQPGAVLSDQPGGGR
ncbi:MAG: hypothetical protein AABZ08_11140 [Planctomycetota bacterium]